MQCTYVAGDGGGGGDGEIGLSDLSLANCLSCHAFRSERCFGDSLAGLLKEYGKASLRAAESSRTMSRWRKGKLLTLLLIQSWSLLIWVSASRFWVKLEHRAHTMPQSTTRESGGFE